MNRPKRTNLLPFGPAALVAAAFIGPGTITTCTLAGARFGYALLWGMLFSVLATIVLQDMSSRLGIITRKGLGEAIRESARPGAARALAVVLVLSAIVVGNAAFETGNLLGGGLGLETLAGIDMSGAGRLNIWAAVIALLSAVLLWAGSYKLLEQVLVGLVILMSITFIGTMIAIGPSAGRLFHGLFVPTLPKGSALAVVGLIGTTVVPYNLFLHASAASERFGGARDLKRSRADIFISIGLGGIISLSVIVTAAVSFYGTGDVIRNAADMAVQLEPLLGRWARWMMATGLFAAGLTSAITAPLAAAYAAKGILGWQCDRKGKRFRAVWAGIILVGLLFSQVGASPVEAILFAQVANGILLPVIATYLLWIMNRPSLLGSYRNRLPANLAGGLVVVITIVLSVKTILTVFHVL